MIGRYTLPKMAKIWTEETKFEIMLRIEILACEAQAQLGNIPKKVIPLIKKKAGFNIERILEIEADVHHDVIAFLTNVSENVGEESKYIHIGLTSSDILDTSLSLRMKQAGEIIIDDLNALMDLLANKAKEHKNTVMMGRTHGVHAEPMTFGLKMALWLEECKRNLKRLIDAIDNISYGKLSGAVGTFSHIDPYVEKYVCKKLGLLPAPVSTQILQRDRHAQVLFALSMIASSLEKFALEIRNLSRTEVGEVEEGFGAKQKGSSAMPHKKNPIITERIMGLARLVRCNALAGLENIALWHERDISHSSTERVIIPDSYIVVDYMLHKFTSLMENLRVYSQRMKENIDLTKGLIFSQRVLLALVNKGVLREEAYWLVQENSRRVWESTSGRGFKDMLLQDKEVLAYLSIEEIEACFDIKDYLKNISKIMNNIGI